jgi:hypothetical protein
MKCWCGPTATASQYGLLPSDISERIIRLFRLVSHLSIINVQSKNVGIIYSFILHLTKLSVAHNMQHYNRTL